MAKLEGLVFQAATAISESLYHIVDEVYAKCKAQENLKDAEVVNFVNRNLFAI
jgi:amidophosphoribosyltransferase